MSIHNQPQPTQLPPTLPEGQEPKLSFFQKIAKAFSLGGRKVSTKPPDGTPKPKTPELSNEKISYSGTKEPTVDKSILSKIKSLVTQIFGKSTRAETPPTKRPEDEHIDRIMLTLATYHQGGTEATPHVIIDNALNYELEGYPPEKALNIVGQAIYKLEKDHQETLRSEHGVINPGPEKWALEMKAVLKEETDKLKPTPPPMQPNEQTAIFKQTLEKYANPNQKYVPEDSKILNEYFKSTNIDEGAQALADLYKHNKEAATDIIKNLSTGPEFKGVDKFVTKFVSLAGEKNAGELTTQLLKDEIKTISDIGTFLRGNSMTTKFVSAYQKESFSEMTQYELNPFLSNVSTDRLREDAPPEDKNNSFRIPKSNQKKIVEITNNALDQCVSMSSDISPTAKEMFNAVYNETNAKFGPKVAKQQVLSLFFLRYANPAIMDYGAKSSDPNQKANITMASKALQNFANNVYLGGVNSKENYLGFMDKGFIDANQDKKDVILNNLLGR